MALIIGSSLILPHLQRIHVICVTMAAGSRAVEQNRSAVNIADDAQYAPRTRESTRSRHVALQIETAHRYFFPAMRNTVVGTWSLGYDVRINH
jgi:hypothetical protein